MVGDGELQEGQNYEALQSTVHQGVSNLTILIDHNKVQSDKLVREIVDLRNLEEKLRVFGWHVARCSGHDVKALAQVFQEFRSINDKPKALIADTLKGRGVSFMEHPQALKSGQGYYRWHSGAPDDASYLAADREVVARINDRLGAVGLESLKRKPVPPLAAMQTKAPKNALGEPVSKGDRVGESMKESSEYVVEAYGKALIELAGSHPHLVVLDADLAADCRVREFELTYPERFIQNGIAEQDMVSMAGGLARMGLLPVVNSFAFWPRAQTSKSIIMPRS